MATITKTTLVDDIDGSTDNVVTCAFGLGDAQFEIDLSADHRDELENALTKFIEYARQVPGQKAPRPARQSRQAPADRELTHAIRLWAKENGHEVSERGRISKAVIEAYQAAH